MAVGSMASVLVNAVVLAITWYKTFHMVRFSHQIKISSPLVTVLLRDGQYLSIISVLVLTLDTSIGSFCFVLVLSTFPAYCFHPNFIRLLTILGVVEIVLYFTKVIIQCSH